MSATQFPPLAQAYAAGAGNVGVWLAQDGPVKSGIGKSGKAYRSKEVVFADEIFYINRAGDGINDMYGLWRYTVAVVLQDGGKRVRSRESVRWWCVRGDDQPVGPGDAP